MAYFKELSEELIDEIKINEKIENQLPLPSNRTKTQIEDLNYPLWIQKRVPMDIKQYLL